MEIKIALAGNPNCGKTTMFNALTGANQYVGNWPGVTVEKKEGKLKGKKNKNVTITDLPGIYSLSPYTLEEVVSRDYLLNDNPDVIINLVDATNIERNLYLTTQLIETGIPVVIALNMADLVKKQDIKINFFIFYISPLNIPQFHEDAFHEILSLKSHHFFESSVQAFALIVDYFQNNRLLCLFPLPLT